MKKEITYKTFMGETYNEEDEAKCKELEEYGDVALAVKRTCQKIGCDKCPFNHIDYCMFVIPPSEWELEYEEFYDFYIYKNFKNKYGKEKDTKQSAP